MTKINYTPSSFSEAQQIAEQFISDNNLTGATIKRVASHLMVLANGEEWLTLYVQAQGRKSPVAAQEVVNRVAKTLGLTAKRDKETENCYSLLFGYNEPIIGYETADGKSYVIDAKDDDEAYVRGEGCLVSVSLHSCSTLKVQHYRDKSKAEHLLRVLMTAAEMTEAEIEDAIEYSEWENTAK